MPQHPLCNKCRQIPAVEGDTWCYGCAGWEAIGRELSGSWDGQGARRVANDLVVNAARQVRALRSLSAGLARESGPTGGAGETRAPKRAASEDRWEERKSLPRRRSSGHAAPKEEQESEEEEDAAEETDEEDRRRRSKRSPEGPERSRGGHRRPPEPDRSPVPPGTTSIRASLSRADKRPADNREHRPQRRHAHGTRRRGGRKHQRLKRLAENPHLAVHRHLSADFLKLATSESGALGLDRLGRWDEFGWWREGNFFGRRFRGMECPSCGAGRGFGSRAGSHKSWGHRRGLGSFLCRETRESSGRFLPSDNRVVGSRNRQPCSSFRSFLRKRSAQTTPVSKQTVHGSWVWRRAGSGRVARHPTPLVEARQLQSRLFGPQGDGSFEEVVERFEKGYRTKAASKSQDRCWRWKTSRRRKGKSQGGPSEERAPRQGDRKDDKGRQGQAAGKAGESRATPPWYTWGSPGCRRSAIRLGPLWRRWQGGVESRLLTIRSPGHRHPVEEEQPSWERLQGPRQKGPGDSPIRGVQEEMVRRAWMDSWWPGRWRSAGRATRSAGRRKRRVRPRQDWKSCESCWTPTARRTRRTRRTRKREMEMATRRRNARNGGWRMGWLWAPAGALQIPRIWRRTRKPVRRKQNWRRQWRRSPEPSRVQCWWCLPSTSVHRWTRRGRQSFLEKRRRWSQGWRWCHTSTNI